MLTHEIITGKPQEIVLILDQTRDNILKSFRCSSCGRILLEYYGGVKLLMPGNIEVDWLDVTGRPKIIQCKNKMTIKTADGKEMQGVKCRAKYYVIG